MEMFSVRAAGVMTGKALRPPMREAILDAAVTVLGQNPGASLAEVAARAGVGRASLHRYFPKRSDLIDAVVRQCLDETAAATEAGVRGAGSARETLLRTLEAVIPLGDRFHFLMSVTSDAPDVTARYQADLEWLAQLVDRLKEEGVIASEAPRAWVAANIDAQIWIAWTEVAAGRLAPADAAGLALRTLLEGLGGR